MLAFPAAVYCSVLPVGRQSPITKNPARCMLHKNGFRCNSDPVLPFDVSTRSAKLPIEIEHTQAKPGVKGFSTGKKFSIVIHAITTTEAIITLLILPCSLGRDFACSFLQIPGRPGIIAVRLKVHTITIRGVHAPPHQCSNHHWRLRATRSAGRTQKKG